jgi:hypothetical protein
MAVRINPGTFSILPSFAKRDRQGGCPYMVGFFTGFWLLTA